MLIGGMNMGDYGEELFKGTASYYSRYRPLYPASLVRFLIQKFSLDGNGSLLDLGCGTGQLAFRFSDWFEKIVGVDTEAEMIAEAKRLSKEERIENVECFIGNLEKYKRQHNTTFRLVTIAKAFHWMDREEVLENLYEMVPPGGGIAIIDNYAQNKKLLLWEEKVNEVVKYWYGDERKAGNTTYSHPTVSHEEIISNSKFDLEVHRLPTYEYIWTIDSIIGNLYSTSYASKRILGENVHAFEQHMKEALLAIDSRGVFKEEMTLSVKLALKNR
jgi:ubiquinone/menaquinone biosynthesis C-methylase UbiE